MATTIHEDELHPDSYFEGVDDDLMWCVDCYSLTHWFADPEDDVPMCGECGWANVNPDPESWMY